MKTKLYLLISLFALLSFSAMSQSYIYVSTTGSDSNDGSEAAPLKSLKAAQMKARSLNSPEGGVIIYLRGGEYKVEKTFFLKKEDSGKPGRPLVISGYPGENVVFDGLKEIDPSGFELATNNSELHNNAAGKVYVKKITNATDIKHLKDKRAVLSFNNKRMTTARFPNKGYAQVNRSTVNSESTKTKGTYDDPKGARFKLYESANFTKWSAEIARTKRLLARGYLSADWHIEEIAVAEISTDGTMRLKDGTNYNFKQHQIIRASMQQLLCELDIPGEWYFDKENELLYIYPYSAIEADTKIGYMKGNEVFNIQGAEYIQIRDLTIQNLGQNTFKNAISIKNYSTYCQVAGVTFQNFDPTMHAVVIDNATECGLLSCNFFDINYSIRLGGGSYDDKSVVKGNNYVENCHFTQLDSHELYGKSCGIYGVGNIYRHNLMHNMNGQTVTFSGPEHLIEYNEAFNSGMEEGDGGVFYQGATLLSMDNVVQHNFVHHIMRVPEHYGRAAFYSDDFDAGEIYRNNITYKGGSESIKINKGGAHRINNNIILDTWMGIRQGERGSLYEEKMDYINNNPVSSHKDNIIGRMLQEVGEEGWNERIDEHNWINRVSSYWKNRYPAFNELIEGYYKNKSMTPYASTYVGNRFYSNSYNIYGAKTGDIRDNNNTSLDVFNNVDVLDFSYKGTRPSNMPVINFKEIGLYVDQYRTQIPKKEEYRKTVKEHFNGKPVHTSIKYDYRTINDLIYYNTGSIVMDAIPTSGPTAPIVKFTTPTFGLEHKVGENVDISVSATANGSINRVDLYINDTLQSTLNTAPYEWKGSADFSQLSNMKEGSYIIKVVATDNDGLSSKIWTKLNVINPVATPELFNVALNKPAEMSSHYYDLSNSRGSISNINDGVITGISVEDTSFAHTQKEFRPWIEMDLEGIYEIDEIRIWNRMVSEYGVLDRVKNFYVFVSNEPFESKDLIATRDNPKVISFYHAAQCGRPTILKEQISGRYLRVQLMNENWMGLAEIEVFGKSASPTTNVPPVANIANNRFVIAGKKVTLNATKSYDYEGKDLSYQWIVPEWIELDDPTSATPSFVSPATEQEKSMDITLIVNDGEKNSAPETVLFKVLRNRAPEVALSRSKLVKEQEAVEISAAESIDPDGGELSFKWILPEIITSNDTSSSVLRFTAPIIESATTINIGLEVSDGVLTTKDSIAVTILYNVPPVASFIFEDGTTYNKGDDIFIDASASNDEDGDNKDLVYNYSVSKPGITIFDGDSPYPYLVAPSDPDTTNTYTLELVVSDGLKSSEPVSATFTVQDLEIINALINGKVEELNLYPNPVEVGKTTQLNAVERAIVKVYDATGRLQSTQQAEANSNTQLQFAEVGIYFVQLVNLDGRLIGMQKLVVSE